MATSTTTKDVTRATYVLGVHRWVAASFGLLTTFGTEWLTVQIASDTSDIEVLRNKYLPYPTLVVYQSWGITVLAIAAVVHSAMSFHPFERVAVCRCLSIMFAIATAIFARAAMDITVIGTTDGGVEFATLFIVLCVAYLWASLEKFPQQSTPSIPTNDQTTLSMAIKFHALVAFFFGFLAVFRPQDIFDYPIKAFKIDQESLGATSPPELFAIQCLGSFMVGIGMLCTQFPSFEAKSQKRFGMVMLFYFVSLAVLYLLEWPQLNVIYQWGSVPIFVAMALLYTAALALLPNPPLSESKKTK